MANCTQMKEGEKNFLENTISHSILLQKLPCFGARGNVLQWFESYLTKRQQRVKVSELLSSNGSICYGIQFCASKFEINEFFIYYAEDRHLSEIEFEFFFFIIFLKLTCSFYIFMYTYL